MTSEARAVRARGVQRREQLLDAAVRVIATRGLEGVSHRSVAEEAGVPTSSTTYFFDSLDHLIAEAVAAAMGRELDRLTRLKEAFLAGELSARGWIEQYLELVEEEDEQRLTIAQFEMYLLAARRPELRPQVAEIIAATREAGAAAARLHGIEDTTAGAAVVALVDGFALHRLADPQPGQLDALRRALRALTIGYVALDSVEADRD